MYIQKGVEKECPGRKNKQLQKSTGEREQIIWETARLAAGSKVRREMEREEGEQGWVTKRPVGRWRLCTGRGWPTEAPTGEGMPWLCRGDSAVWRQQTSWEPV